MKLIMNIPVFKEEEFLGKINKLNRKATKHHWTPIRAIKINEYAKERKEYAIQYHVYEVMAPEIMKIEGWDIVACIDHSLGRNLVYVFNEEERPDLFEKGASCEHCGLDRIRYSTYILRHESGVEKQVGSTCLQDFLGHDPAIILWATQFYEDMVGADEFEEEEFLQSKNKSFRLSYFLDVTSQVILNQGFTSKAQENANFGKVATATVVKEILEQKRPMITISDEAKEMSQKALMWIRNYTVTNKSSDFLTNLYAVCGTDALLPRHVGVAAALIPAYKRENTPIRLATGDFVGKIGERIQDIKLKVTKRITFESGFMSWVDMHILEDGDGHLFKWSTSSNRLDEGKTYSVTGTIKSHEEYKGVKQTVLTRCKVIK